MNGGRRRSKIWVRQLCSVSGCNPQAPQAGHGQLAIYQNRRAATLQSVGETRRTREKCGGTSSFGIGDIPEVLENAAPTVCARCPGSVQAPAALDHSHTREFTVHIRGCG